MAFVMTAALEAAVRAWLVSSWPAVSVPVIFAQQGGRPPASPYCTVKLDGPRTIGGEHRGAITDNGIDPAGLDHLTASQPVAYHQRIDASINIYGATARDLARKAVQGLSKIEIVEALRAAGLAPPHARPPVRNLSALEKTRFEERAQFDVAFALGDVFADLLPLIETFEGTKTTYNPDGSVRSEIDFTAP